MRGHIALALTLPLATHALLTTSLALVFCWASQDFKFRETLFATFRGSDIATAAAYLAQARLDGPCEWGWKGGLKHARCLRTR